MTDRKREDLTIKLSPELRARLEALKKRDDRSLGWLVERCLEGYLPVLEQPHHALNETSPPFGKPGADTTKRVKR
jgi:predicted DNA-binding protein